MNQIYAAKDFALDGFDQEEIPAEDEERSTVLTFALGKQIFAVDVHLVREILDMTEISPIPNMPHEILGMIDLRGQGIAIVDLASRIGASVENWDHARIIVFELPNKTGTTSLGVVADRVLRVRETDTSSDIEPVPDTLSGWTCSEASGMLRTDDGIAMLLRIESILSVGDQPGPFDFG